MRRRTFVFLLACVSVPALAGAQEPAAEAPQTRVEVIADQRAAKVAELWPERQSGMVDKSTPWPNAASARGSTRGAASTGRNWWSVACDRVRASAPAWVTGARSCGRSGWAIGQRRAGRCRAATCSTSHSISGPFVPSGRRCSGTRSSSIRLTSTTTALATSRWRRTEPAIATTTSPPTSAPSTGPSGRCASA